MKLELLKRIIAEYGKTILAYSGGVDSTFLAKVAFDVLGDDLLAVTAVSETYPETEYVEAAATAKTIGFPHRTMYSSELKIEGYAENTRKRCYYCRGELFGKLKAIKGYDSIMYGAIVDDLGDHRPGMVAARELGVKAPLIEAGLTKDEIRTLSKQLGLATWNKPSAACLSSRIPYGTRVTEKRLRQIEMAENILHELGFRQVRVRYHDELARIEVEQEDIPRLIQLRHGVAERFKQLGFKHTTIDLQGYRSGSMNESVIRKIGNNEFN